jgi:uncharacterized protein
MTQADADALTDALARWVRSRPDIDALGVAGSWARGAARPDSDLDLIMLADDPESFRTDQTWLERLPIPEPFRIGTHSAEEYGPVWSCRMFLQPDAELELTFGPLGWARTEPVDPGTRRVVGDGFAVIVDKSGRLQRLVEAVRSSPMFPE